MKNKVLRATRIVVLVSEGAILNNNLEICWYSSSLPVFKKWMKRKNVL